MVRVMSSSELFSSNVPGIPHTIMVTGVGALIGQGIIQSLKSQKKYRIVGLDRAHSSYAASLCDHFYTKPCREESPEYLSFLRETVKRHAIKLVIPGIEQDIEYFHQLRSTLDLLEAPVVLNNPELIEVAADKGETMERISRAGMPSIPTYCGTIWEECVSCCGPAPWLLKPRRGSGSRGQAILENQADFDYWLTKTQGSALIQHIVGDPETEYTVAVFGFGDGTANPPAILRRKLGPGGATVFAETVPTSTCIELSVEALNRLFRPLGPTNYQFRVEGDVAYLLEINPRISASTSMRHALGYNEAQMCVDYFVDENVPQPASLRLGRVERYLSDFVSLS